MVGLWEWQAFAHGNWSCYRQWCSGLGWGPRPRSLSLAAQKTSCKEVMVFGGRMQVSLPRLAALVFRVHMLAVGCGRRCHSIDFPHDFGRGDRGGNREMGFHGSSMNARPLGAASWGWCIQRVWAVVRHDLQAGRTTRCSTLQQ